LPVAPSPVPVGVFESTFTDMISDQTIGPTDRKTGDLEDLVQSVSRFLATPRESVTCALVGSRAPTNFGV
jgi:hypothetical protein